jgi:RNA 2',3'-cyclic 3'-phosphodiesterase
MNTLRAFFAITFTGKTQTKLASLLNQLKQQYHHHDIRWTDLNNLHITLQFIPHLNPNHIDELVRQINTLPTPFSIQFGEVELFPSIEKPKFISLHVEPNDLLAGLAKQLSKPLQTLGYAVETLPFRGHITLGRIRGPKPTKEEMKQSTLPDLPSFSVQELVLLESKPDSDSSRYFPLAHFKLS